MGEKGVAIPGPFDRDLGKQQATAITALHDQAVTADLDLGHISDLLNRTEHRNLHANDQEILHYKRREPRVLSRGRDRAPLHDFQEVLIGLRIADAAS
jgi:hypothetical protein